MSEESKQYNTKMITHGGMDNSVSVWGWLVAMNASSIGAVAGFFLGFLFGFGFGYWWHYDNEKDKAIHIERIAEENKAMKIKLNDINHQSDAILEDSLRSLGIAQSKIDDLLKVNNRLESYVDRLISQFRVSQHVDHGVCENDAIGTDMAKAVNTAIQRGVDSRARNAE